MNMQEFLNHFKGIKQQKDNSYMALCPGHKDKNPSLSISQNGSNKILLHCHAGCEVKKILSAAGLSQKDLFNSQETALRPTQTGCSLSGFKADKNKPITGQPFLSIKGWGDKPSKTKEIALNLLHNRRKIDRNVILELFEAGQIKTGKHANKDCVAFPFFDISSENVHAVQYITADGEPFPFTAKNGSPANKIFGRASSGTSPKP